MKQLTTNSKYLVWNGDDKQYAKLYDSYMEFRAKFDAQYPHPEKEKGFIIRGFTELTEEPFPPSRVEVTDDGYLLHVYGRFNSYPIERSRVRSHSNLLVWISHLCEKTWCDTQLISDFIEAVYDRNGWKRHYGC